MSKLAVATALALTVLHGQSALAQASGQTAVTINFPNVVILHYPANLTLDLTALATITATEVEPDPALGAITLTNPISVNAGLTATGTSSPLSVDPLILDVVISQMWAVRGITTTGNITVTGTIDNPDATNGSSTASMSNLLLSASGLAGAPSIDVTAPGFALANAVIGDIAFELDLSAVTTAGSHTGILYTIEASAP